MCKSFGLQAVCPAQVQKRKRYYHCQNETQNFQVQNCPQIDITELVYLIKLSRPVYN